LTFVNCAKTKLLRNFATYSTIKTPHLPPLSFDPLFDYIKVKSGLELSRDEKVLVQNIFVSKHLRKRQYLLQEGDVCKYMAFILKGSGRTFAVNDKGQEHIIRFAIENWWLGDYESYNYGTPSMYNIEMLEDSDVLLVSKSNMDELSATVPPIGLMIKEIDRKGVVTAQKRIHSSISLSAEERYDTFATAYPEILNRFPLSMIASYLGISPETLSRIRKNMLRK
jgi:CRP-like cAMP-binding protein